MTTSITTANHQVTRSTANASSYTLGSYAVGSGSNRVLEVTVSLLRSNENGITVDGVTFGGVALTEGDRSTGISTSRSNYVGVWYLVNPSVSTANIVVTPSATMAGCIISAVTLYGVHQTIPTGDSYRVKDATFGEFDINCGLAQTGGLCVLAVSANANNNPTWTWSGGGSELYDANNGSSDSNEIAGSAILRDSDVGGATCTCSISTAMMVGVGVEFLPVGLSIYQQTISISASSDDAGQNSGGSMFLTSTSGNVNNTGDTYFGLRFLGLNLPAGAFPLAAFVRLSVASTTYDTPILTLNTEQNDEPATFAGTANNISSRSLTGESTTWDEVNIGAGYRRSPNFRRSLDVTVGLGGWAAGDDVVVVLTNAGPSSAFRFNTYDYSSGSEAPQLIVTWMVTTTVISASAADTLDLTETPSRRAVYRKTAADTFGAVETRQRRGIYRKTAADALRATETHVRRGVYRKSAADLLHATETRTRRVIYRKTIADLLDATGSTTPRRVLRATAFETLDMVSSLGRRADYDGLGIDLLKLLEAAMGGGRLPAVVTDSLEVSEATGPGYVVRRVAADTWQLLPAAGRRASFAAAIGDELGFTDTALYPVPSESGEFDVVAYEDSAQGSNGMVIITNNEMTCRINDPYNALEFRDLDIPPDAIVTVSNLLLYVVTNDDPGLTIKLQKTLTPAALTATNYDISTRTPLTTGVEWSAANIGVNAYKASPDFSVGLMEVLSLPGWTRGANALVVILSNNGTGGHLSFQTSEAHAGFRPKLHVEWYVGGLTITATAADGLALLDDTARRALISQATADSLSLAAATTTALSLLLSETWQLSETVALLAGLSVGDVALLGDSVFLTYAATLIEPVKLLEALNRIATLRAGSVDALDYIGAARTKIVTGAGDALELSDGLTARRILAAIAADAARYNLLLTGDMAGVLEAIAADTFDLSAVVAAGWRGRVNAADALEVTETAASMRRFLVAVADAGAIGDVAALMRRARATGQDAAEFGDALRALMRTRAHDAVDISDAALAQVAFILHALAADVVALSDGTVTTWRVTARDRLEFVATVGAVMHWIESVQDVLGLHVAAVYLLPSGIVRIEFAIKGARIQFDIAMPRVDATLKQPRVDLAGHGLIDS